MLFAAASQATLCTPNQSQSTAPNPTHSPPAVGVDAALHSPVECRIGDALNVRVGQRQDVVEAGVPGLEVACEGLWVVR